MLEFLKKNVCLLVITTVLGCLLRDIHLIIIQLPLQILQNQLLPVILVLQRFVLRFEVLYLTYCIHPVILYDLTLQQHITLQLFIGSP